VLRFEKVNQIYFFCFYISYNFGKRTGAAEAVLNVENSAGECCFCFFTKAMDPSLLIQS